MRLRPTRVLVPIVALVLTALPGITPAHELDHDPPPAGAPTLPPTTFISGGDNVDWELVKTIATGNPHTDLDFFTKNGETYVAVGTLGTGFNQGGQNIIRLTKNGKVNGSTIEYISGHPSAECPSEPSQTLGLQHDVEATPKGAAILNTRNKLAVRKPAQLIVDATDNEGRCHDNGSTFGAPGAPKGGLEIVDITNINNPEEIALTSHIGEAHTVNIDPKRPHIAYAVTSDAVSVSQDEDDLDGDGNTTEPIRENEDPNDSDRFDLDGFEVVDMSSCMNLPKGMTLEQKRDACKPKVYRYRYPTLAMSLGHTTTSAVYGCHELEIYPNDRLTCGSGAAAMLFDMSRAFNDNGTPNNYTDDKPRGRPMPCRVRDSSSDPFFQTGAKVTDCVTGRKDVDLTVPNWLKLGKPGRLRGVEFLGSAHHMGRGGPYDATQDIDFNHETELTHSRDFIISTDERGGGVSPPGATCSEGDPNKHGNGGLHAYRVDRLQKGYPSTPKKAWRAYARTPKGRKAIFRAPVHTGAELTTCTAHVFQQVPGQNRIFMGWYSQGTQVVDFIERPNGTFQFKHAGYFIPTDANEWTSHVFKFKENYNGTFTYWGVATDFKLDSGRNAVDIYKVTMPRPPLPPSEACNRRNAIVGTDGPDSLVGTPGGDIICGLDGNDKIRGRGGDDIIVGGRGDDKINAGARNDIAHGQGGRDTITGRGGKDQLSGDAGNDSIDGNRANDVITGGGGRDSLRGNKAWDTIKGGAGKDSVQGGRGNDSVYGNPGGDTLKGFTGDDFLHGGKGIDTCIPGDGDDRVKSCEFRKRN